MKAEHAQSAKSIQVQVKYHAVPCGKSAEGQYI